MRADKGLLSFHGRLLIENVLSKVVNLSDEIIILSNHEKRYQRFGYPVYGDIKPGLGTIGGMLTAIEYACYS